MINADTAKARLEAQLIELKERHDRIGKDLAEPLSPDFSEQATEVQDDTPLERQAALITRQIASVKRALTRIENGFMASVCGAEKRLMPSGLRLVARQHCALSARARNSEVLQRRQIQC